LIHNAAVEFAENDKDPFILLTQFIKLSIKQLIFFENRSPGEAIDEKS